MDPDKELYLAGTNQGQEPSLVNTEFQPSNVNLRTGASFSTSLSRSGTSALSNQGIYYHIRPHGLQNYNHDKDDHDDHTAQNYHQPRLRSESSVMSDARTRSTSFSGPSSLPETHASGGEPPFSPPFLHPLSLRTKSSRMPPPLSTSTQRYRDGHKSRTRFTIGSSRPNSPSEPEPKRESSPTRLTSPFTIRGFLALSTFSKVVAVLFAFCVFLLVKALLGVGHSAESCGVFAHKVTDPGPRSGSSLGSVRAGADMDDPNFHTKGGILTGQMGEAERARVRLERIEEMYGYQYDWKLEYEVEHDDDGDDRYDDEYEHDDFLDPA